MVEDTGGGINGLGGGNLDDPVVGTAADEVGSGSSHVDLVGSAGSRSLVGLKSKDHVVDHLKEVGAGAGDAVGRVVVDQHLVLHRDAADRPLVGDGKVVQGDVLESQVLVEGGRVIEHSGHVGHRRDVPSVKGLVEGGGSSEHPGHVGHRGGVPEGYVLVEGGGVFEHLKHIDYQGGVPGAKGLVEVGCIPEHPACAPAPPPASAVASSARCSWHTQLCRLSCLGWWNSVTNRDRVHSHTLANMFLTH